MALHDIETVNIIRDELDKIDPELLMYGEGWTGGESPLPSERLAYKWNSYDFGRVGLFNDNIRDAIKGGTFNPYDLGYVSGNRNAASVLRRGIAGSVPHHQITDAKEACWAFEPSQAVNYCEAHDNNTLWDKLTISGQKNYSQAALRKMDKLAAAIVMLSQGMPFIQLGQDFLRSKPRILDENETPNDVNVFSHNSYNAPDYTNSIKWNFKKENKDVFDYYKALIKLRKESGLFRLRTKGEVDAHLKFLNGDDWNFIIYTLENDSEKYVIVLNPYDCNRSFRLPEGRYVLRLDDSGKSHEQPIDGEATVPPLSAAVYKRV
jgi:pullulanase